ncbi:MAG: queuosine precursor transporter [Bacteroidetes bacterium]|nr:queuosine precursor transporter [Bacteroidota bacterium]
MFNSRKEILFVVLAMFFVTNAITAEMIGGKLIEINIFDFHFAFSMGILPWPIVFISTDLINEYFGKKGVRKLSVITACLIGYAFLLLYGGMNVPAAAFSPVQDKEFNIVFGQSMWIIVGSIIAFLVSQIMDVFVFWFFRALTKEKFLWLRTTGSTVISQLIDSFIVLGIGFLMPGKISFSNFLNVGFTNYSGKLILAILLTPLIYLGHFLIDKYLGEKESEKEIEEAAEESLEKN